MLPFGEWLALSLGKTTGFSAPATALLVMPDGLPPALIVERFDIRTIENDNRLIAMEDLCSVLDLPPSAKYTGTMERVGRAIRPLSTAPDEDLLILLRRALFTWLIADGDMHLKNMALLKIAYPGDETFREVRLAPLYDTVTTRIFPKLEHDRMALKLNGKDDRLRRRDFRDLAATIGVKARDADGAIDDLKGRLRLGMEHIQLPELAGFRDAALATMNRILDILRDRLGTFDQ
jgi:serine/threonine-protein kinase HipA